MSFNPRENLQLRRRQWGQKCWRQKSLLDCGRSKPEAHQFECHDLLIKGDEWKQTVIAQFVV
jgi:hypothetical protein